MYGLEKLEKEVANSREASRNLEKASGITIALKIIPENKKTTKSRQHKIP
jgi:hypothetical protein